MRWFLLLRECAVGEIEVRRKSQLDQTLRAAVLGLCSTLRKKPLLACFSEISHASESPLAYGYHILNSLGRWQFEWWSDEMADRRLL